MSCCFFLKLFQHVLQTLQQSSFLSFHTKQESRPRQQMTSLKIVLPFALSILPMFQFRQNLKFVKMAVERATLLLLTAGAIIKLLFCVHIIDVFHVSPVMSTRQVHCVQIVPVSVDPLSVQLTRLGCKV